MSHVNANDLPVFESYLCRNSLLKLNNATKLKMSPINMQLNFSASYISIWLSKRKERKLTINRAHLHYNK